MVWIRNSAFADMGCRYENKQQDPNWNTMPIKDDWSGKFTSVRKASEYGDTKSRSKSADVEVFFDDLTAHLIHQIRQSDFVIGCVAWLTNFNIIDALATTKKGCQVVVQKEDFLRPDWGSSADWNTRLRRKYESLHCKVNGYESPGIASQLNMCGSAAEYLDPVRCAGNHNADKKPAHPRMHHKFMVFCDVKDGKSGRCKTTGAYWQSNGVVIPRSVWTGSFNPTLNGGRSRENAVLIRSPTLAERYAAEWAAVYACSEFIDWTVPWTASSFRVGS